MINHLLCIKQKWHTERSNKQTIISRSQHTLWIYLNTNPSLKIRSQSLPLAFKSTISKIFQNTKCELAHWKVSMHFCTSIIKDLVQHILSSIKKFFMENNLYLVILAQNKHAGHRHSILCFTWFVSKGNLNIYVNFLFQ